MITQRIKHLAIALSSCVTITSAYANEPVLTNQTADNNAQWSWLETNVLIADQYIVPRYQAFVKSAQKLSDEIKLLCASDKEVTLSESVQSEFESTYINWAKIQHIKFGPISFLKRLERIQYWPDKHNVSERQVRKLLVSLDAGETLSLAELQKKSVAVQGLATLERLLFSKDALLNKSECQLATLVSENITSIAIDLDNNWRSPPVDFASEFSLADHGEGTYGSSKEISSLLADSLVTQLLLISEYKLGRALPKEAGGRVYSRRLEAWRSGLSSDLLLASLNSLYSFYQHAFEKRLGSLAPELNSRIGKQFQQIIDLASKESKPISQLLESETGIEQLSNLQTKIKKLELMIRNDMYSQLGFSTRFNSLDGD